MKFNNNFWKKKIDKADYFGRIPDSEEDRGFSCLFYDVSDEVTLTRSELLGLSLSRNICSFFLHAFASF